MHSETHEAWVLDVTSPADAAGWLEDGSAPAGDIRILVDESAAESDRPYHEDSHLGYTLSELGGGIADLLSGDAVDVELDAAAIRLTPVESQDAVEVFETLHGVPEEVREYEPKLIDTEAFVVELYGTVRAWYLEAAEINPRLNDSEWFQDLELALDNAERAMLNAGIDVPDSGNGVR